VRMREDEKTFVDTRSEAAALKRAAFGATSLVVDFKPLLRYVPSTENSPSPSRWVPGCCCYGLFLWLTETCSSFAFQSDCGQSRCATPST